MKLSDIVAYRNHLRSIGHSPSVYDAVKHFESVEHVVVSQEIQVGSNSLDLRQNFKDIKQSIEEFQSTIDRLEFQLDSLIADQEQDYYAESTRRYEEEMMFETAEYILNRRLVITDESRIELESRIKNFTDWRLPGLIIRPGRENFIESLVPLDPLYVVDHDLALIDPAIIQFTAEYQRRLRPYVITETPANPILDRLPDNQFGFVFAYNFFNFKPIEIINRYLRELYQKMRPGGAMIFTFNDCDFFNGVGSAEQNFQCYTPGRVVKKHAEDAGFEISREKCQGLEISWLELKKPGEITSLRGGQALAKILVKPK